MSSTYSSVSGLSTPRNASAMAPRPRIIGPAGESKTKSSVHTANLYVPFRPPESTIKSNAAPLPVFTAPVRDLPNDQQMIRYLCLPPARASLRERLEDDAVRPSRVGVARQDRAVSHVEHGNVGRGRTVDRDEPEVTVGGQVVVAGASTCHGREP